MKLNDENNCTSCMACYASCHFEAINLQENKLGVLLPKIDVSKCSGCGKCQSICNSIKRIEFNKIKECYACYTKNKSDIQTVTSGGAATVFTKAVIKENGYVFGTTYDFDPKVIKIEKIEDVEKLKGSKYVYSYPNKIYADVLNELIKGSTCLFIGTPCQIAAVKAYCKKHSENLICVDLICHGAPPFKYLQDWINKNAHFKDIKTVSFRGKDDYKLVMQNDRCNTEYIAQQNEDLYFTAFSQSLIHREVCYSCPYATEKRVSDITIGDFWGLDVNALGGYSGKKSVVLINTDKGKRFFEKIKNDMVYEKREISEAVNGNKMLRHPTLKHIDREKFEKNYANTHDFYKAVKKTSIRYNMIFNKIKNIILKRK